MAKTYTDYLQEILNAQEKEKENQKAGVDKKYESLSKEILEKYSSDIQALTEIYDDYIDKSYVQKLIDKKQVQETLANMGLTDSGIHRTEQTAVQLSHSNRVGKYTALKQQQIDSLAKEMRGKLTDAKIQAENEKTTIDNQFRKEAESKATEFYKNQETQEDKQENKQEKAWTKVVNSLFDDDVSSKERTFILEEYFLKYGFNNNEKLLLDKMQIDYKNFGKKPKEQKQENVNYGITEQRKSQLQKLCKDTLITKQQFNNERKLGNFKGTYNEYVEGVITNLRFSLRINQAEFEYLLDYYGLNK